MFMGIDKQKIPKTDMPIIRSQFKQAAADAETALKEKSIGKGEGPFGEPRELLAFAILEASGELSQMTSTAQSIADRLMEVFRDVSPEISVADYLESATLCLYGFILGTYNEEDFRYIYRYSLSRIRNHASIESWLRKAIVFYGLCKNLRGRDLLDEFRHWIRYLGASACNHNLLVEVCAAFGEDIRSVVAEPDFRFVDSLQRHPQYLEEAMEGKSYLDVRNATKDWLQDVMSERLLRIYQKRMYKLAQDDIKQDANVAEAFDAVRSTFKKAGFRSDRKGVFPVRLQKLSTPPPAEAVDPIVFEMIPQKLRVNLLPSVAYSTKTKTVEIIFLGGPRIGRSGILLKTDTGGVLLDYGLSVANQRIPEWVPELEMIDTVLISHAHLDHVGGLPVLYDNYDGKWCSTGVTGAIAMSLLEDALKVGTPLPPRRRDRWDSISKFRQRNIDKITKNHVRLEVGKSSEVGPGIVVTPIDASHIPGSASFLLDIEGVKILYTGDFNTDKSVLFPGANLPTNNDVTIFDGTYWGRQDFNRADVTAHVAEVIESHGPVIIPSFAVGRTQEMLMILESIGVTKSKNVIVAGLAEKVTKLVGVKGHWQGMKKNKVALEKDDILVAGSGMMSGGLARYHFKEHSRNPEAAIILCGYLAPRTPGWNLLNGFEPHKCHVEYARLSAHSSASHLQQWVKSCSGKKIMVHTPSKKVPRGIMMPDYKQKIILST